jgi:hypothetical protein
VNRFQKSHCLSNRRVWITKQRERRLLACCPLCSAGQDIYSTGLLP